MLIVYKIVISAFNSISILDCTNFSIRCSSFKLTVEVFEEEKEELLQVIRDAKSACEVVSVRRVNQNAKGLYKKIVRYKIFYRVLIPSIAIPFL